jgi:hypothetical protein
LKASATIADAAERCGWTHVEHKLHKNVLGRRDVRLVIGYSPTGRAVECALYFPDGFGIGYIDDPTPFRSVVAVAAASSKRCSAGWPNRHRTRRSRHACRRHPLRSRKV